MVVLTVSTILKKGLEFAGFSIDRQANVKKSTNIDRFCSYYGSNPVVYAQLWEDLRNAPVPLGNFVELDAETEIAYFFTCLHFLKSYPIEVDLAGIFQVCEKTVRQWVWVYAAKIQGLKQHKVCLKFRILNQRCKSLPSLAMKSDSMAGFMASNQS
jgi:hypothetical protein